jgi:cytochrome oxidase Cu insertion factor (SCO1/SenC/PrrC family)
MRSLKSVPGSMGHWGVGVLSLGVLLAASMAPAQNAPAEKTGLAVGAQAPEFKLKDQNGREHSLTNLLQKGKVAAVFYRSADW